MLEKIAEKYPDLPIGVIVLIRKCKEKKLSVSDAVLANNLSEENWNEFEFVRAIGLGNYSSEEIIRRLEIYCLELAVKELPEIVELLEEQNDEN
jgi:hypothetical protein